MGAKGDSIAKGAAVMAATNAALMNRGYPNALALDYSSNPILNIDNVHHENAWMTTFLDKIVMQTAIDKSYKNSLAELKQEAMPFGRFEEVSHTNPAKEEDFNPARNPFERKDPDTAVQYHELNRFSTYPVTVEQIRIREAFHNAQKMDELTQIHINTIYTGNQADEEIHTQNLFDDAITSIGTANPKIVSDPIAAEVTDEATAKAFITRVNQVSNRFTFLRSRWNSYQAFIGGGGAARLSFSPKEDQLIIMKSDLEAVIDVNVLAFAFHMDKATLKRRVVLVEEFANPKVQAILCDKSWPKIRDQTLQVADNFNGGNMTTNYFLHVKQMYSLNLFANAVAFVAA